MEQLPISTHIVVVSHSGGKLSETNANALPTSGVEGSFADLLAAQINVQDVNGLGVPGAAEGNQLALQAQAEAPAIEVSGAKADEQATQQLAEVLSALPLPQYPTALPVDNAIAAGEKGKSEDRLSLAASVIPGSTATSTSLVAQSKPEALLGVAAKTGEEPAIIAAVDKALPSKQVLGFEVVEAKQTPLMPTQMPTMARAESAPVNVSTPPTPIPLSVDIKVGTPGWDTAFSQRVAWAATNQHQVAELRLNPPNLGPVEIRITISNDQATAVFVSPHASVRDSIEAALPRLREMLGESGLTLGNVNVSSQSFQQQQQAGQGDEKSNAKHGGVNPELALASALPAHNMSSITVRQNGLVDIFA